MPDQQNDDDSSIEDHFELWRRIPPKHVVFDNNSGELRPTSAAFDNDPDGEPMSILIAPVMTELGLSSANAIDGHPGFALASITAGLARECSQKLVRDPLENEPAHGLVVGRKTQGTRRRLARASRWIIRPSTVGLGV